MHDFVREFDGAVDSVKVHPTSWQMYFRLHGQNYWVRRQFGSSMGGHANTIALRTGLHRGFYYIHPISSLDLLADWLRHESLDFDEMHKQGDVWRIGRVLYVALHDGKVVRRQMGLDKLSLGKVQLGPSFGFSCIQRWQWYKSLNHNTYVFWPYSSNDVGGLWMEPRRLSGVKRYPKVTYLLNRVNEITSFSGHVCGEMQKNAIWCFVILQDVLACWKYTPKSLIFWTGYLKSP